MFAATAISKVRDLRRCEKTGQNAAPGDCAENPFVDFRFRLPMTEAARAPYRPKQITQMSSKRLLIGGNPENPQR